MLIFQFHASNIYIAFDYVVAEELNQTINVNTDVLKRSLHANMNSLVCVCVRIGQEICKPRCYYTEKDRQHSESMCVWYRVIIR